MPWPLGYVITERFDEHKICQYNNSQITQLSVNGNSWSVYLLANFEKESDTGNKLENKHVLYPQTI